MFIKLIIQKMKTIKSNRWIPLKPESFDESHKEKRKGIHIEVSLSPYDIPEGVLGFFREDKKQFVIKLKYISEEPTKEQRVSPHMCALIGRNSGRLYGFLIDVGALDVDKVSIAILEELNPSKIEDITKDNSRLELNKKLVQSITDSLLLEEAGI